MFRLKQTIQQQAKTLLTQNKCLGATQFSIAQQYMRHFSQFQTIEPRVNPTRHFNAAQNTPSVGTQNKSYLEIVQNIEKYQQNIEQKTSFGMGLSKTIVNELEPNKYQNQQMYEIFIQKMDSLYKSELRFQQRLKKKLMKQKLSNLYSHVPLKDILRTYNEMTSRGFSSELLSETLKSMDAAIRTRGFTGRVYLDYTQSELEQSWRFNKVIDDINHGLRPEVFFSPHHLGQTTNLLADINIKSSQLMPKFFDKIKALIKERETGEKENPLISFNQAVYGGYKNYLPRHYVFKGFQNSKDFDQHVQILLDWQDQKSRVKLQDKTPQDLDQEVSELQAAMKELIDASVEVKEVQKDLQATIENVRTQYFKMLEASDKHAFLQENEYIRYDLLELQEMLVKSGYLNPEEALQHLGRESFESKMDRASQVFYDYVINYAPEVISPQHEEFYQAAIQSINNQDKETKDITEYLNENHNVINLGSLSQILAGLQRQALVYRKDMNQNDYLNEFYYKFCELDEYLKFHQKGFDHNARKLVERQNVKMERCYLRPWQTFKTQTDKLIPYMRDLVKKDNGSLDSQLLGLLGFATVGHDEPALRKEMVTNSMNLLKQKHKTSRDSIKGGLMGLAMSSTQDEQSVALGRLLSERIDVNQYEFSEQIDLLWSLCALQLYDGFAIKKLVKNMNKYKLEKFTNEIKFEEFEKLMDVMTALSLEAPESLQITNKAMKDAFASRNMMRGTYRESEILFDPFKKRVVSALAQGLTKASVQHQVLMEEEIFNQQVADQEALNPQKYPYKPDLIMGYKGQKVAMFVLPEMHATRDTFEPNGTIRFRMRLLEKAHNGEIKAAAVAVNNVVSYDIEKMKVDINNSFNFQKLLDERIDGNRLHEKHNFSQLSEFGYNLVKNAGKYQETQPLIDQVQKVDSFIKKIFQIFQMKQQTDLRFDSSQRNAGYDQLRFQLMIASIMYDGLNNESKQFVNQHLPKGSKSLKQVLLKTASSIQTEQDQSIHQLPEELNVGWLGTRLEVELPQALSQSKVQKAIEPEMINQRFMWVQDYFHYKDWQQKQESVYDNFNLLQIPHIKDQNKYYFDQDSYHRRIPQGIFPFPNHKREILRPVTQYAEIDYARSKQNDDLVLFEKEPFKMMILKEFEKSQQLKPINNEISMITNLQNIKQGLKSDYSDRELLSTILLNLNFTEQLIEEHLGLKKNDASKPTYLKRDATSYRDFVKATYDSKDRQDPFTHFFLKEAAKKQVQLETVEELAIERDLTENSHRAEDYDRVQNQLAKLEDKIDKVLIEYEIKNEDLYNLSTALPTSVNIQYDVKSLVKSEFVYDMEPELIDRGISDEEYLQLSRRRAESKLIKSKIIYKINKSEQLSQNESTYLKAWLNDITQNDDRNILNLRDSLLPNKSSGLSLKDIDAKNFYTLNTISKVELDRQNHGQYALSDLVLELSHFLDEEVVNKVESDLLSDKLRTEWGVTKDFKIIETRNKEISILLNEMEELAYRASGEFDQKDLEYIKAMLSIGRNKDIFDKTFYQNDMKSLESFTNEANKYDNRIELLERYIRRKEVEIKERVVIPPENLRKTDQQLHEEYDKPLREAREKLVARLITTDEHGNAIDKQYKDLSSRELGVISENLAVRVYMFNYEYPKFLPQAVKAIMEHPNLLKSDKEMLQSYCRIFELDWKGDTTLENRSQLLFQAPIYLNGTNLKSYGELTNQVVQDKMRRACAPYVDQLVEKMLSYK